jgi:phosphate-selective porin OprO and OprP
MLPASIRPFHLSRRAPGAVAGPRPTLPLVLLAMSCTAALAQGTSEAPAILTASALHAEMTPTPATVSESAPAPERSSSVRLTWADDRPSLRLWHDAVRIDLRARLQVDVASSNHATNSVDETDVRQRRIGVSGSVRNVLEFQVERELFGDKGWRDVFADVRVGPALHVQGGRFKMPFSMDQLTSSANLAFVTRSLAARWLSPSRDIGVMAHGRARIGAGPRVGYEIGLFRHDGENAPLGPSTLIIPGAAQSVNRLTGAGRLQVAPFERRKTKGTSSAAGAALQSLRLGFAATIGEIPEGDNSLRGQDSFSKPFFPRVDVKGRRVRTGAEASWRAGRASVRAEVIHVRDERREQGLAGEDLPPLTSTGWYAQGTWTLVKGGRGGSRAGRWIGRGGLGDVELAARVERLSFASGNADGPDAITSPRAVNLAGARDTVATFGVNWRPAPVTRIQLNVIRDEVGGAAWTKRYSQPLVWGVVSRFQLSF